jgi:hypothetical protein
VRLELLLLLGLLLRELLLLLEVLQLGVVDAGVIAGVGRKVELGEVLGGIYCGWFIILGPVRHGHSPPICRYGETFIDVRKRLRDLIVNRTTRVSRLDEVCDPKSRLIARRNTGLTATTQHPIISADMWDTALGLPLLQQTCTSTKGRFARGGKRYSV